MVRQGQGKMLSGVTTRRGSKALRLDSTGIVFGRTLRAVPITLRCSRRSQVHPLLRRLGIGQCCRALYVRARVARHGCFRSFVILARLLFAEVSVCRRPRALGRCRRSNRRPSGHVGTLSLDGSGQLGSEEPVAFKVIATNPGGHRGARLLSDFELHWRARLAL